MPLATISTVCDRPIRSIGCPRFWVPLAAGGPDPARLEHRRANKVWCPSLPGALRRPASSNSGPEASAPSRVNVSQRPCGSGTESRQLPGNRRGMDPFDVEVRQVSQSGAPHCPVPLAASLASLLVWVPSVARCPPLPGELKSGCPSLPGALHCLDARPSTMSGAPRCRVPFTAGNSQIQVPLAARCPSLPSKAMRCG